MAAILSQLQCVLQHCMKHDDVKTGLDSYPLHEDSRQVTLPVGQVVLSKFSSKFYEIIEKKIFGIQAS